MSFLTSLEQYQTDNIFGGSFNDTDLSSIEKALEARSITGRETTDSTSASGAPLKAESLEKNLKLLTFRLNDIRLFRDMPNSPAYNTVEEFAQLVSYGDFNGGGSGFITEGSLPGTEDSVYRRRAELVKYMGVTKAVTHPMQLVKTAVEIGSIVQQEVNNATMWILRACNRALTFGNAATQPVQFNGIFAQHQTYSEEASYDAYMNSAMVIDLRGSCMTQSTINDASQTILYPGYGTPTTFYGSPKMLGEFGKDFFTKQRIMLGSTGTNISGFTAGGYPKTVSTVAGEIELKFDVLMQENRVKYLTTAGTTNAPGAVTKGTGVGSSAAIAVSSTDTLTKFGAASFGDANGAGDYYYAIAATNAYGESALTLLNTNNTTAITATATTSIDMSFVDGGGSYPATAYVVYRTKKGATGGNAMPFYPLFTVSKAEVTAGYDGGGAGVVRDRNRFLPDCEQGFVADFTADVLMWKQLAPLMKIDLARIDLSTRFATVLYGTPQLYAPKKLVRIINAGPYRAS